jgi:hypothetical protein
VAFEVKDIAADEAARKELVDKYWRLATPAIVIDEEVFVGFRDNRARIEKLLS